MDVFCNASACDDVCLNWLGGFIGVLIAYFLGAFWYSKKCFGLMWMKALGKKEEDFQGKPPLMAMLVSFLYLLVLGIFIVMVSHYVKCPFIFASLMGILILSTALGILQGALFQSENMKLYWINAGYEAMVILVISLCVALI